ncbi:DEP domain-containing protein 1B-like isoform X2 [Homalodisca vitripennis]|nr:DEP domain-containing protein 1B-like isoform X2 [Homalodisca vitripennis]
MPTRRHFYRMRYYDNCFTGKEAVDWLSKALANNPRFGKKVTIDGTRQLLQHFLKAGVFHSVKSTYTFKDSGLFEFVNRNLHSSGKEQNCKLPIPRLGLREIDSNSSPGLSRNLNHAKRQKSYLHFPSPCPMDQTSEAFSYRSKGSSSKEEYWKDFIIQRIQSLVPSLSVELLIDTNTLRGDWVMFNVCHEYDVMRRKTELPFWVFTAITSVTRRSQESESEYTTYSGFEKDVYTVVQDYLKHRSSPMVPYYLYELVMYTFNHLHYLDLEMKNRSQEYDSVENLMLSMSDEWNDNNLVNTDDLARTVLPPNSCFETAFTSDEPVTRIIPQSSVDTICLATQKNSRPSNPSNIMTKSQTNIFKICEESNRLSVLPEKQLSPMSRKRFSNKNKPRRKTEHLRRTQSMAQMDRNMKQNTLPLPTSRQNESGLTSQQSYVNYGLSQSMDDLLVVDDGAGLDFEAAMQSVNCLMKASCGPRSAPFPRSSTESQLSSVSSSLESVSTVGSYPLKNNSFVCIDSCMWYEDIQETARSVFQSLLMLMSPENRTSLSMLLQFIHQLPVSPHSTITKMEMVYDLSTFILSPHSHSKNIYSHQMVLSVVYFLTENCHPIFENLPQEEIKQNKENKVDQDQKVFCKQLTQDQFVDQGATSSWLALSELLDQIINDKNMKSKEKKKRLKKFKEEYPHIYKQRCGGSSSNLASLIHFR